jgi:hypothetical protein
MNLPDVGWPRSKNGGSVVEFFMLDEETTVDDQPVITRAGDLERELKVEIGFLELEVVAFAGAVKIVGYAHFGISGRATSRRASDYIRHFNDTKLTLSRASVYRAATDELIETVPFAVLNLDRVEVIYARDIEPDDAGASRGDRADPS